MITGRAHEVGIEGFHIPKRFTVRGLGWGQTSFTLEASRKDVPRKDASVSRVFVLIIIISQYPIFLGLIVYKEDICDRDLYREGFILFVLDVFDALTSAPF